MTLRTMMLLLALLLSGCASAPLQVRNQVLIGEIETLQGPVSVTLATAAGTVAGRGILFYRKPGNFRLSMISPFGQVMLDMIVAGQDVTCILPPKKQAWRGTIADLPEKLGTSLWPLMSWMVERLPAAGPSLERDIRRSDGTMEKIFFDSEGLIRKKINFLGDQVSYDDYQYLEGVAVPLVVQVETREGSRLKLIFDEPEVNRPIADDILHPPLDGIDVFPLRDFTEF